MALATRCPACTTVFRISTAQAAAKGGMVRCGQCRHKFDSLDALVRVEDLEVIEEVIVEAPPQEPAPSPSPLDPRSAPTTPSAPVGAPVEPMAAFETFGLPAESDRGGAPPAGITPAEWWLPEARSTPSMAGPPSTPSGPSTVAPVVAAERIDPPDVLEPAPERSNLLRPPPPPPSRAARWLFGTLSLLALVVLLGQSAYLWRDELAARWPPARPWLITACEALRCRVEAPAHLDAITIESARIQALPSNANQYVLTALLRNREAIDLRYPHLELALTDLQDRPILRRALRPQDYLPAGQATTSQGRGFPAESELPIRVVFDLDDQRFAGYRLDRFYP